MLNQREVISKRINAALKFCLTRFKGEVDPKKVIVVGFCFGGLSVLDYARFSSNSCAGVVSIHGLLNPPKVGFFCCCFVLFCLPHFSTFC